MRARCAYYEKEIARLRNTCESLEQLASICRAQIESERHVVEEKRLQTFRAEFVAAMKGLREIMETQLGTAAKDHMEMMDSAESSLRELAKDGDADAMKEGMMSEFSKLRKGVRASLTKTKVRAGAESDKRMTQARGRHGQIMKQLKAAAGAQKKNVVDATQALLTKERTAADERVEDILRMKEEEFRAKEGRPEKSIKGGKGRLKKTEPKSPRTSKGGALNGTGPRARGTKSQGKRTMGGTAPGGIPFSGDERGSYSKEDLEVMKEKLTEWSVRVVRMFADVQRSMRHACLVIERIQSDGGEAVGDGCKERLSKLAQTMIDILTSHNQIGSLPYGVSPVVDGQISREQMQDATHYFEALNDLGVKMVARTPIAKSCHSTATPSPQLAKKPPLKGTFADVFSNTIIDRIGGASGGKSLYTPAAVSMLGRVYEPVAIDEREVDPRTIHKWCTCVGLSLAHSQSVMEDLVHCAVSIFIELVSAGGDRRVSRYEGGRWTRKRSQNRPLYQHHTGADGAYGRAGAHNVPHGGPTGVHWPRAGDRHDHTGYALAENEGGVPASHEGPSSVMGLSSPNMRRRGSSASIYADTAEWDGRDLNEGLYDGQPAATGGITMYTDKFNQRLPVTGEAQLNVLSSEPIPVVPRQPQIRTHLTMDEREDDISTMSKRKRKALDDAREGMKGLTGRIHMETFERTAPSIQAGREMHLELEAGGEYGASSRVTPRTSYQRGIQDFNDLVAESAKVAFPATSLEFDLTPSEVLPQRPTTSGPVLEGLPPISALAGPAAFAAGGRVLRATGEVPVLQGDGKNVLQRKVSSERVSLSGRRSSSRGSVRRVNVHPELDTNLGARGKGVEGLEHLQDVFNATGATMSPERRTFSPAPPSDIQIEMRTRARKARFADRLRQRWAAKTRRRHSEEAGDIILPDGRAASRASEDGQSYTQAVAKRSSGVGFSGVSHVSLADRSTLVLGSDQSESAVVDDSLYGRAFGNPELEKEVLGVYGHKHVRVSRRSQGGGGFRGSSQSLSIWDREKVNVFGGSRMRGQSLGHSRLAARRASARHGSVDHRRPSTSGMWRASGGGGSAGNLTGDEVAYVISALRQADDTPNPDRHQHEAAVAAISHQLGLRDDRDAERDRIKHAPAVVYEDVVSPHTRTVTPVEVGTDLVISTSLDDGYANVRPHTSDGTVNSGGLVSPRIVFPSTPTQLGSPRDKTFVKTMKRKGVFYVPGGSGRDVGSLMDHQRGRSASTSHGLSPPSSSRSPRRGTMMGASIGNSNPGTPVSSQKSGSHPNDGLFGLDMLGVEGQQVSREPSPVASRAVTPPPVRLLPSDSDSKTGSGNTTPTMLSVRRRKRSRSRFTRPPSLAAMTSVEMREDSVSRFPVVPLMTAEDGADLVDSMVMGTGIV